VGDGRIALQPTIQRIEQQRGRIEVRAPSPLLVVGQPTRRRHICRVIVQANS
jgi:hypothetical protein